MGKILSSWGENPVSSPTAAAVLGYARQHVLNLNSLGSVEDAETVKLNQPLVQFQALNQANFQHLQQNQKNSKSTQFSFFSFFCWHPTFSTKRTTGLTYCFGSKAIQIRLVCTVERTIGPQACTWALAISVLCLCACKNKTGVTRFDVGTVGWPEPVGENAKTLSFLKIRGMPNWNHDLLPRVTLQAWRVVSRNISSVTAIYLNHKSEKVYNF